jgi:hypothetical protein
MADRSLNTGEFNEHGEWNSYRGRTVQSGPSPIPLLVLAVLIAMIMLLRPEGEPQPQVFGAASGSGRESTSPFVAQDSRR